MFTRNNTSDESHWIPLADLMTGMMMMFLLIATLYMLKISQVASEYRSTKDELGKELCAEFYPDLENWGAECDPSSLVIRFKSPDVLFDTGQAQLKPRFTSILNNFFPRYIKILTQEKYKTSIEEIRIEGHTSSFWSAGVNDNQAYFLNMELSQARTRSVLQYLISLPTISDTKWVRDNLTANGLSSSKPILNAQGQENFQASQRVEFRIKTNAEQHIDEMLKAVE